MQTNFEDAYNRIKKETQCNTQLELAEYFSIKQSLISDAVRKRVIPDSWLLSLAQKKCLSPSWILSGEGEKYLIFDCSEANISKQSRLYPEIPLNDLIAEVSYRLPELSIYICWGKEKLKEQAKESEVSY